MYGSSDLLAPESRQTHLSRDSTHGYGDHPCGAAEELERLPVLNWSDQSVLLSWVYDASWKLVVRQPDSRSSKQQVPNHPLIWPRRIHLSGFRRSSIPSLNMKQVSTTSNKTCDAKSSQG